MKTVYLDPISFECYTEQNADCTRIPYETEIFNGKCNEFIRGYRVIPKGYSMTRSDGVVFTGEMVTPRRPYGELAAAQAQYERERLADAENALSILLGGETV